MTVLTDAQKHQFETLGFLCLRELLGPDEMRTYAAAFDEVMLKANGGRPWHKAPERQQVIPFFNFNPTVFHRMLDDERILEVVEDLLRQDFIYMTSEGIHLWGGTAWHHDDICPPGQTHIKVVFFMESHRIDTGCLCVLPGSQFPAFRQRLEQYGDDMLAAEQNVPGTHPIESNPGDVVIFDVKAYHAAFGQSERRGIYLNYFQKPTNAQQQDHIIKCYSKRRASSGWADYTPELFEDASPRRMRMLKFVQQHCYQPI